MFCTEIQIRANLCIKCANEQDFVRGSSFFTKFHRFGLQKAIFSTISVLVLVYFFCAKIQICATLCSFLIGNGSTSRTPQEVYHFSAKFYRFGLQKGILSKILVSVVILFCARIQIQANLYSFSIGNGLTSRTPQDAHHFSAKFHRFGLRNGIFFKSFFLLLVFFFAPKFKLAQICAIFRLEMGQRAGIHKRFIVFRPNSIVSVFDMAFFF